MSYLLDGAVFTAASGGTGSFTVSAALTGYRTPVAAGAIDGRTYRYRAQSNDLSQWEVGTCVASSTGTVFSRVVLFSSTGGTVNFTNPPTVAITITADDLAPRRDYIVNGGMMISQDKEGTAVTATSDWPVDMFQMRSSNGGTWSAARVASPSPGGSTTRLRVTVTSADASVAAGDFLYILHPIEGTRVADLKIGTASAKTAIIQFGVKAPAGTYGVSLRNSAVDRSYIAEFTIAAGEANTDVVKQVTFTLDTTGTWLKDPGVGLYVSFTLMAGSTFQTTGATWAAGNFFGTSSQFNLMGTNSNVFELFDVSMFEGSGAPPFALTAYDETLAQCRRYFRKSFSQGTACAQNAGLVGAVSTKNPIAAGAPSVWVAFDPPMRIAPTITTYNPSAANANWRNVSAGADVTVQVNAPATLGAGGVLIATSVTVANIGENLAIHYSADARM